MSRRGVQRGGVNDIISVKTSHSCFEVGRCVEIANAKIVEIGDYSRGIIEPEGVISLARALNR